MHGRKETITLANGGNLKTESLLYAISTGPFTMSNNQIFDGGQGFFGNNETAKQHGLITLGEDFLYFNPNNVEYIMPLITKETVNPTTEAPENIYSMEIVFSNGFKEKFPVANDAERTAFVDQWQQALSGHHVALNNRHTLPHANSISTSR